MEKFKRTFSLRGRKKKPKSSDNNKPFAWHEDEQTVRDGTASFPVKYLGCVEVFESRGMGVCEEAVKLLRTNARKAERFSFRKKPKHPGPVSAILHVTGDSLRVVENRSVYERIPVLSKDDHSGLLVDQTIEKVSFCAPDRNYEKAFAYICRDGTTRRWMCHGFLSVNDTGERLSHAVGCAFAVCLEKKQKREKESVEVSFNAEQTSFTRTGSFRQTSLTERMQDPQSAKIAEPIEKGSSPTAIADRPKIVNCIDRPRPSISGVSESRIEFPKLNGSPFKRNASLRMNELPSTLQRQAMEFGTGGATPQPAPDSLSTNVQNSFDPITMMCQQLTQGLTTLTAPAGTLSQGSSAGVGAHTTVDPAPSSPNPFLKGFNVQEPQKEHLINGTAAFVSTSSSYSANPFQFSLTNQNHGTNPFLNRIHSQQTKHEFTLQI